MRLIRSARETRTFAPHSSDGCSTAARYCLDSPLGPSSLSDNLAAATVVAEGEPESRHACAKQVFAFLLLEMVVAIETGGSWQVARGRGLGAVNRGQFWSACGTR